MNQVEGCRPKEFPGGKRPPAPGSGSTGSELEIQFDYRPPMCQLCTENGSLERVLVDTDRLPLIVGMGCSHGAEKEASTW